MICMNINTFNSELFRLIGSNTYRLHSFLFVHETAGQLNMVIEDKLRYNPSEEEKKIWDECMVDCLWYRSLPAAATAGINFSKLHYLLFSFKQ